MNKNLFLLFLPVLIVLSSCAPTLVDPGDQPVSSDDTPAPTITVDLEKFELGEQAIVETAEPVFLESFPLQVHILINGNLPDGCTEYYRAESERDGELFTLRIFTLREKDAMCTQALVPFEANVPLDVFGLPAGTYQVMVYDVRTEFTFDQDNIIQEPEEGN